MFQIQSFTCEGLREHLVTDCAAPTFAYFVSSDRAGASVQSAELTVNGWTIRNPDQCGTRYAGQPLKPFTTYTATLTVTSDSGETDTARLTFETGRMDTPWQGKWITDGAYVFKEKKVSPVPMVFRKALPLRGEIAQAKLYATAMGIYELNIDGQKVEGDALKNVDSESVASVTVLKGKSAEDAGYESKGDNHKVIAISTKDGATTVENGESKTVQTTTVVVNKIINSDSEKHASKLNGAKLILDGKQITAEELGKVDSSQIDNIVVNKSSGENVIRITTKQFDPMEYSQLENAEIRVDGKTVKVGGKPIKASSLRIIPAQNNIANINIDKRDDKTVVDIRTKDGKGLKKQKTKKSK